MGRGVNKVILLGVCGQDPDVRYTGGGAAVANVSIATSESWKDKSTGEKQEKTEWHNLVFFGKLAEIVNDYVKKGSKIYVEGQLTTSSWEQDGVKRYKTEIKCNEMQMLDSKPEGSQGQQGQSQQRPQQQRQQHPPADNFDDKSIPF